MYISIPWWTCEIWSHYCEHPSAEGGFASSLRVFKFHVWYGISVPTRALHYVQYSYFSRVRMSYFHMYIISIESSAICQTQSHHWIGGIHSHINIRGMRHQKPKGKEKRKEKVHQSIQSKIRSLTWVVRREIGARKCIKKSGQSSCRESCRCFWETRIEISGQKCSQERREVPRDRRLRLVSRVRLSELSLPVKKLVSTLSNCHIP